MRAQMRQSRLCAVFLVMLCSQYAVALQTRLAMPVPGLDSLASNRNEPSLLSTREFLIDPNGSADPIFESDEAPDDYQNIVPPWTTPRQYTLDDLAKAIGKPKGQLTLRDVMALRLANDALLQGADDEGSDGLLKMFASLATTDEAKKLDQNHNVLAPLEEAVLDAVNLNRMTGNGPNTELGDLKKVYLSALKDFAASEEAKQAGIRLFNAMRGAGTKETELWDVLGMRSTGEIAIISDTFRQYCQTQKQGVVFKANFKWEECNLFEWLRAELSGGDIEKADDLIAGNPPKEDAEYYYSSAVAKYWNGFLKESDANGKAMVANGNWLERTIGHANQAVFAGAGSLNDAVKVAQKFWIERAQSSSSSAGRGFNMVMFVFATIGGSFGSKGIDPNLTYQETEEGLFDLALTLGTMGAGKLATALAGTKQGLASLNAIGKAANALSRQVFAIRQLVGIAPKAAKLTALSATYTEVAQVARAAGNVAKADKAAEAALHYGKAAEALAKVEAASAAARTAAANLDAALAAGKSADEILLAQKAVADASADTAKALDKALAANSAARTAAWGSAKAGVPVLREVEAALDGIKNFLGRDVSFTIAKRNARLASHNAALIGSADDALRAQKLSPAAVADDVAAVEKGAVPKWASKDHGGLVGGGTKHADPLMKQQQFWDKEAKCWRNGPGSLSTSGETVGKSIAGDVVPMGDSGFKFNPSSGGWVGPAGPTKTPAVFEGVSFNSQTNVFKGPGAIDGIKFEASTGKWVSATGQPLDTVPEWARSLRWNDKKKVFDHVVPAVDICKVNPAFCSGAKGHFCKRFPALCEKFNAGGLPGRPRETMPQIENMEKFLDYLASKNNGVRPKVTMKDVMPEELSISQAEINAHKTASIGDNLADPKGFKPSATVVADDLTVLDGHHRWSAYMWSKYLPNGPRTMPVAIIDMPIDRLIALCDELMATKGVHNGVTLISFAGLLETDAELMEQHRARWVLMMNDHLRDAGLTYGEHEMDSLYVLSH